MVFGPAFARFADNPCVSAGERTLSYAETLALGRRITAGLRPRSLVVLRCALTPESLAAHAALLIDGHVPLLIEASLAPALADALIATYAPDAVIDPSAAEPVTPMPGGTPLAPALALLLTTSGSTGSPKLVRQSATGIAANAAAIAEYLALDAAERAFLHLPMSYSYGLSVIHSHWHAGASICLTGASVMEAGYWDELAARRATSIAGVPFHYAAIRRLGEARLDVPSLKTLTQAGGRLDPRLVAHFTGWAERSGRRFVVMYGQTEAGPRIAWLPPEHASVAPDSIGIAIPGVRIALCDDGGAEIPDGTPGEMRVHSPAVMLGYATTAADLGKGDECGGVLATGDMAVRGADGLLRITGRRSRMLKIYGLRVNIDEIEARLAGMGHAAHCFGEDDQLRVLVEPGAAPVDAAALRTAITQLFSLPPRGILVRAAGHPVPRSPAGKVSAAGLAEGWAAADPAVAEAAAP